MMFIISRLTITNADALEKYLKKEEAEDMASVADKKGKMVEGKRPSQIGNSGRGRGQGRSRRSTPSK